MLGQKKIGFIGGGQMCEAIASGALTGGILASDLLITDINADRLTYMSETYGVSIIPNDKNNTGVKTIAKECQILVLAVKPQFMKPVLEQLGKHTGKNHLVISIMGGVRLETLEKSLPDSHLVRVMPNTPMLVGKGVAGITPGHDATEEDIVTACSLFGMVGSVYQVPESLIDPLTGISGCGPAFAYLFIEALSDAGVEKGLPRQMALELAAQTLAGAGEMVLKTGKHPAQLKDSVTSPGGGTIVGVHALEEGGFRAAVIDAVVKSVDKMEDLGKK